MKKCKDCENVFPSTTSYFYKLKYSKDDLGVICKKCMRIRSSEQKNRKYHIKMTRYCFPKKNVFAL